MIKKSIKKTVNLTCSIGIAPVRFLAKIASDLDKPDGLTLILPDEVEAFIQTLPIRKVPGVGKVTHNQLKLLGIRYLGDIKSTPIDMLIQKLGKYGERLLELANGSDATSVTREVDHKSISTEHTLSRDTKDKFYLNRYILNQSIEVAQELRKKEVWAKTITLKIKHADFKSVTRSKTIPSPTQSSDRIYRIASKLLAIYPLNQKIRLIGVGASNFSDPGEPVQLNIFTRTNQKNRNWEKVDRAIDSISEKFGKHAVKRAGMVQKPNKKNETK